MKILIYAELENSAGYTLKKMIWKRLPRIGEVCLVHTVLGLLREIRHPMCGYSIFIFFPENKEKLEAILDHRPILEDLKKILVLPEEQEELVALAMKLQPVFVSYMESDCHHVLTVLDKIVPEN